MSCIAFAGTKKAPLERPFGSDPQLVAHVQNTNSRTRFYDRGPDPAPSRLFYLFHLYLLHLWLLACRCGFVRKMLIVEVLVVQDYVEDQRIRADGFATVNGVVAE